MNALFDLLSRAIPIMVGGGMVQAIIFLLRRRGEMRKLDADAKKVDVEADAVVVASAASSVALANSLRDAAFQRVGVVEVELKQLQEQVIHLAAEVTTANNKLTSSRARESILEAELSVIRRKLATVDGTDTD